MLRQCLLIPLKGLARHLRTRHYSLFRKIVESRYLQGIISALTRSWTVEVVNRYGDRIVVHPLFHAQLAEEVGIDSYEHEVQQAIDNLVQPASCAYDVGANVGVLTCLMVHRANVAGKVYAFEPAEINLTCLRKTKQLNGFDTLCIEERCVTDRSGTTRFDARGGAFSGRAVIDENGQESRNISELQSTSLDDFVYIQGERAPEVVKIDVEGNEVAVLKGMQRLLSETGPAIICELHTHLGDDSTPVFPILSKYGYTLYALTDWLQGRRDPLSTLENACRIVAIK